MTERTAWLTMARAYETDRKDRSEIQYRMTFNGLCYALELVDVIDEVRNNMKWDLKYDMEASTIRSGTSAYVFNDDYSWDDEETGRYGHYSVLSVNDALRADYCRFQYYRLGGMEDD